MTRVRFDEGETGVIEGDILSRSGAAVPVATLTTATLTLYDFMTAVLDGSPAIGVINDRYNQDILNTNDVTIDSAGHFVWAVQPADNAVVTERRQIERHRALFQFAWPGGVSTEEFEIEVMNLRGM